MFSREIEGHSLWAWTAAAAAAPIAQFLGSAPWYWTLAVGLAAGGVWLAVQHVSTGSLPKALAAVEWIFLIYAAAVAADWSGACWPAVRSGWVIPAVLLVLSACAAEGGCRSGARCGAVLFWFLAGLFVILVGFALPDVRGQQLLQPQHGHLEWITPALLVPAAGALLPRRQGRSPWLWAVGLALCATAVSAVTAGVLSPAQAGQTPGAFYEMVRGLRILGVTERFEAVVAGAMTIGWFCLMSLLLTAAGHMAETLHPGWGRPAVWLAALLAGLASPWAGLVPPAVFGAGAIMLWCLIPLLVGKKQTAAADWNTP